MEKVKKILDYWDKLGIPRDKRTEYLRRTFPNAESIYSLTEEQKDQYITQLQEIVLLVEQIQMIWDIRKYVPIHQINSLRKHTGKSNLWELTEEELKNYLEYLKKTMKEEEKEEYEARQSLYEGVEEEEEEYEARQSLYEGVEEEEVEPVVIIKDEDEEAETVEAEKVEVEEPKELSLATIKYFRTLAIQAFKSRFFPDLKNPEQAVIKILRGQELGLPPMTSLEQIYVINGRTALSYNIIGALIKRSGKYDYRVVEWDDQHCKIEFYRGGKLIGISEFTMEDARRAGLLTRESWNKYPRIMLLARALAQGARAFCPDVVGGGVYKIRKLIEEGEGNA